MHGSGLSIGILICDPRNVLGPEWVPCDGKGYTREEAPEYFAFIKVMGLRHYLKKDVVFVPDFRNTPQKDYKIHIGQRRHIPESSKK